MGRSNRQCLWEENQTVFMGRRPNRQCLWEENLVFYI